MKIGGVVNVETFMDTGSGINLAGLKFAEKFRATEPRQTNRWMKVGRRMLRVPVFQFAHRPVNVRLAD